MKHYQHWVETEYRNMCRARCHLSDSNDLRQSHCASPKMGWFYSLVQRGWQSRRHPLMACEQMATNPRSSTRQPFMFDRPRQGNGESFDGCLLHRHRYHRLKSSSQGSGRRFYQRRKVKGQHELTLDNPNVISL